MIIIGLTGSIAMGKSTVAAMMADMGIAVHDADAAVHLLLDSNLPELFAAFPQAYDGEALNREKLGDITFHDKAQMKKLEGILHPLVRKSEQTFLKEQKDQDAELICLDIPLLFETGAEARVDVIITATAPAEIQRMRALSRPNMNEQKFEAILNAQMPDAQKCANSDYTINTGITLAHTIKELGDIIEKIKSDDS